MLITYKVFIMNTLERIKKAVKMAVALGFGKNQAEIGRKMGYGNNSAFSHVLNGVDKMPADFIDRLCEVVPTLNVGWLESGEGEMFADQVMPRFGNTHINGNNNRNINSAAALQSLVDEIAKQRETYTALLAQKDEQINKLISILSK